MTQRVKQGNKELPAKGCRTAPTGSAADEKPSQILAYWFTATLIAVILLGTSLITDPAYFSDADIYLIYLSSLVHLPPENWWYFEPLSNVFFYTLYFFIPRVEPAIHLGHYVNTLAFFVLLLKSVPARNHSWKSLLFIFAVLGPLLAFVTLRATPAYFMVVFALQYAVRRTPKCWLFLLVAFLFHGSALLALPPLFMLYFRDSIPKFARFDETKPALIFGFLLVAVAGAFYSQFSNLLNTTIGSIPGFSKYAAYSSQDTSIDQVTSASHYIYLIVISAITIFFVLLLDEEGKKILPYVIYSFAVYITLFAIASPVASFRQSPYWVIPMIAAYPWHRVRVYGLASPIFFAFCLSMIYIGITSVYAR